jgi:hypothetical protein
MQNSNKSAKSKRGVILFAFNSPDVNYVGIADSASKLITHALNLPVTLVTDSCGQPKFEYDRIIRVDSFDQFSNFRTDLDGKTIAWKNFGRYTAYELSPYEETILIDTDYLVLDNSLIKLFETDFDYKIMHHNRDTNGPSLEEMGATSLPFVWATVVLFRKTDKAKMLFDMVGRVQRNYHYYCQLYNIPGGNYRNDYAFAIANCVLSGYNLNEDQGIPWTMLTIEQRVVSIQTKGSLLAVKMKDKAVVIPKQCVHVMDKDYLQSNDFARFVEEMCV